MKVPQKFLKSKYRAEMWKNSSKIITEIEKQLPISSAYLFGSFVSEKRRPADMDFMILLRTKKNAKAKWSFDLVIAPDNLHGDEVLKDIKKWMKQKYGAKNSSVVKLK